MRMINRTVPFYRALPIRQCLIEVCSLIFRPQPWPNLDGGTGVAPGEPVRDLRNLLWASIDNDDSRDLDQLTVAEAMPGDQIKILVAIADVDSLVKNGSAIDRHGAVIRRRSIRLPRCSPCCRKNFLPTSPP